MIVTCILKVTGVYPNHFYFASDFFWGYTVTMKRPMKKKKPINIKDCGERSKCPMTNTLDLIGDKWTLLVTRDMIFFGRKQFRDFLDSPEGISTNILTERLKRLEKHGIIEKHSYHDNPVRYEYSLTQIGQDLEPVLLEINRWGKNNIEGIRVPKDEELEQFQKKYSRDRK